MMDKAKVIEYIETSFLASLINDEEITDISFNGSEFFYVSNSKGRNKSVISVEYQSNNLNNTD